MPGCAGGAGVGLKLKSISELLVRFFIFGGEFYQSRLINLIGQHLPHGELGPYTVLYRRGFEREQKRKNERAFQVYSGSYAQACGV